jgi:hypothetical protein
LKKFLISFIALMLFVSPVEAGWKSALAGAAVGYAAKRAPAACLSSPACSGAVERTALALAKEYGQAAVSACLNSPKCLGALVAGAAGVAGAANKEELAEWFNSYMGKGKGRDYRNGNAQKNNHDSHDPDPDDEEPLTTLQAGGNTLSNRVSNVLNKRTGRNATSRDWGRALERMKGDNSLPADHHGIIRSDGAYLDSNGRIIAFIEDYLP